MSDFSHYALQKAVYETLNEDVQLAGLVTGVFDRPPQGQLYPYITVGEAQGSDWSTSTTTGMEHTLRVEVWSREGGRRQIAILFEHIYRLMHDQELDLEEYSMILMRFLSSDIIIESDGATYHGIMRFRTLLQAQ